MNSAIYSQLPIPDHAKHQAMSFDCEVVLSKFTVHFQRAPKSPGCFKKWLLSLLLLSASR